MCKTAGGSWTSTVISPVHYPAQPSPTQPNPTFPFFQSPFSSGTVSCLPGGTPSSVASVKTNTPVLLSVTKAPSVCHQAGPSNTRHVTAEAPTHFNAGFRSPESFQLYAFVTEGPCHHSRASPARLTSPHPALPYSPPLHQHEGTALAFGNVSKPHFSEDPYFC